MSRPLAIVEATPVPSLADVLDEITDQIATYIECSVDARNAMALWTAYTHAIPPKGHAPFDVVGYLFITSVERQSGKTTLMSLLRPIAARPLMVSGTSAAAMLRAIGRRPTLFHDEVDTVFRQGPADVTQETLRGIYNSGFREDGVFLKYDNFKETAHPTFGPKALAGIGREIPESIYDRCITIVLERRETAGKRTVKRARLRRLDAEGKAIAARIEAAVEGLVLEPFDDDEFPEELPDRAVDIWEPLLSLGRAAGPVWELVARNTAIVLSQGVGEESLSERQQLLRDIRIVFDNANKAADFISTQEVIGRPVDIYNNAWEASGLCAIEDGPWAVYKQTRRPITPHMFWKLITGYDIPKVSTGQVRGMRPSDFADAFARYLPKADGPAPR